MQLPIIGSLVEVQVAAETSSAPSPESTILMPIVRIFRAIRYIGLGYLTLATRPGDVSDYLLGCSHDAAI